MQLLVSLLEHLVTIESYALLSERSKLLSSLLELLEEPGALVFKVQKVGHELHNILDFEVDSSLVWLPLIPLIWMSWRISRSLAKLNKLVDDPLVVQTELSEIFETRADQA